MAATPAVRIALLADHPAERGARNDPAGFRVPRSDFPLRAALGAAGLQPGPDIAGRPQFCPSVVGVIVAPGYRGVGIGRRLLAAITPRAQAHGIGSLYVVTGDGAGFYRRCGWELVDETTITGPDTQTTERVNVLRRSVGVSG